MGNIHTNDLDQRLAARLGELRRQAGLSLEELGVRTGISRGTLSRMERGETSPTAANLGRLAAAFSCPMSQILAGLDAAPGHLCRKDDQLVWTDPETGFQRRSLSPAMEGYRGAVIEGQLPAGRSIAYDRAPVPDLEHHLVLLDGTLMLEIEGEEFRLQAGDTLKFRLTGASRYTATETAPARYILTVITP